MSDPKYHQAYYKDPEYRAAHIARASEWNKANPEKRRVTRRRHEVKKKYGLTLEAYEALMEAPACAACGTTAAKRYGLDHCHATGKVREVLCVTCNTALGMVDDDVLKLQALIDYVERHR